MSDLPPVAPALPARPSRSQRLLRREAAALPADGTNYIRFLRGSRPRWWRGALGLVLAMVTYLVVTTVVAGVVFLAIGPLGGVDGTWFPHVALLINLAAVAAMLPVVLLVHRWVFGVRARWLHSVEGRFRWGIALKAGLIAVVPLVLVAAVPLVWEGTPPNPDLSAAAIVGVVGAVMLVPFQSAAEEYLVRGLVARSTGSWMRAPWAGLTVSVLTSSVFFALLHANLLPGPMIYYVLFAALLWLLAWRTGGLEAAVAVHAVFNTVNFVVSFLYAQPVTVSTSITSANQFESLWALIPVAVGVAIILWWFRRTGVNRSFRRTHTGAHTHGEE